MNGGNRWAFFFCEIFCLLWRKFRARPHCGLLFLRGDNTNAGRLAEKGSESEAGEILTGRKHMSLLEISGGLMCLKQEPFNVKVDFLIGAFESSQ